MSNFSILKNFGLIILLWNCRSLLTNLAEFNNYINKINPNIICLTETWLKGSFNINFKGYNVFRNDRFGNRGGGVAILVKQDLIVVPNNFTYFVDGFLESLVITVLFNSKHCNICVLYNPLKNVSEDEFSFYFNNLGNNSIICGDFNAHDSLWSGNSRVSSNFSGKSLSDAYISNPLFNLLTPPALKTHFNLSRYRI